MTLVKFASICDRCGTRSPEYDEWPTCRVCDDHLCPNCWVPGTYKPYDLDSPATVMCEMCQTEGDADVNGGPQEDDEPLHTRGPMHEASEDDFNAWAEAYDDLNGAPENDDDR